MSVITAGKTAKTSRKDPWYVRGVLIAVTTLFLGFMVIGPLVNVFGRAFEQGSAVFFAALTNKYTLHALGLTVLVAVLAVGFNLTFGIAAAWAIARFHFRGKALLTSLIDLPFSVSPVIAGLIFVLLFGTYGYFGPMLRASGIRIIFAVPGIVLATTFVTLPFIARELIPVLEALGPDEEEASRTLGASPWQMFRYVTLPNIKWGLLYGVLLCNARAIGEFGAVNVVSGKRTGQTDTLPILIEKLYEGMGATAAASAFAVATLLACLALLTLIYKTYLERRAARDLLSPEGNEP
jgi:sulfate/thiosulfate transport system permease protein